MTDDADLDLSYAVRTAEGIDVSVVLRLVWDLAGERPGTYVPRSVILLAAESRGLDSRFIESMLENLVIGNLLWPRVEEQSR